MSCGIRKRRKSTFWTPLPPGVFKLNVDGASKGKLGPLCAGGVLRNSKGKVLLMFFKSRGIQESNETEVLAILEAIRLFS